ncbi:PEGA domain-containing protein [Neolewinella xylanilytica]|uniref:PEGA domain-containing protein n=1 Tax=Neolewinella xylanilytica TaxID=1514080 RepID=A0A2S6I3G0_9BACT|nr:PEGA domain-containing protein [Neolewinella xylanilytica]PPK85718.1 PEGA domain-containing protein [Neolewinella xylanilytica]
MRTPLPLFILLVTLCSNCATVFSGTTDQVFFDSQPGGAAVYLDDHFLGRTPLRTSVPRSLKPRYVTYELDGHEPSTQLLRNRVNGVTFINLLWWPGFIIDAATGAINRLEYNSFYMEMYPLPDGIRHPDADTNRD